MTRNASASLAVFPGCVREMDQHEVADARRHFEPERADLLGEPFEPLRVVRGRALDMSHVGKRSDARGHGRGVHVERPARAVDRIDDVRGRVHPAEPQRRQPVDFRKRAQHHHVVAGRDQFDAGLVVVLAHVFRIGRVDREQYMRRQGRVQAAHLRHRQIRAGRIVRVGDEDDLGLRRHRRQDGVDVGGKVFFRRHHGLGVRGQRGDPVHEEAVRGVDCLVAGHEKRARQERQ